MYTLGLYLRQYLLRVNEVKKFIFSTLGYHPIGSFIPFFSCVFVCVHMISRLTL